MAKPKVLTRDVVARELGVKAEEIVDVLDEEVGLIVQFTDGTQYVNVSDDNPDAEGKTGWMFLTVPAMKEGKRYQGTMPVYAQPIEPELDDADEGYPAKGNVETVLGWVAGDKDRAIEALEVENTKDRPRSSLVDELEAILEQYAEEGAATEGEQ